MTICGKLVCNNQKQYFKYIKAFKHESPRNGKIQDRHFQYDSICFDWVVICVLFFILCNSTLLYCTISLNFFEINFQRMIKPE